MDREPIWLRIFAVKAKVNAIVTNDYADFGLVRSGRAWFRGLLHEPEYWSIAPLGIIQSSIDHDR
jgi:hypothetical protein